ncbi:hypothetical protein C8R27_103111 [Nitrosomonas ureae]|uniref:hypothetical protein n=1 Tax=Nitrosomonas ureae TaxID=44577 RepID=UPI000D76B8B1|nr:hypothetical protein [Nitrosomonas ureae]PXX17696.1 hypothetical protein C8R27_103111 [Nitrosomonas ureae]
MNEEKINSIDTVDKTTNQKLENSLETKKSRMLITFLFFTVLSYFVLFLIDNSSVIINILKSSKELEVIKFHVIGESKIFSGLKLGKNQNIAIGSLALILNISFVLSLSGLILSLLSISGVNFVDKIVDKIIENAMGNNAGGSSSFFSVLTILGASLATAIGVVAINSYKLPPLHPDSSDYHRLENEIKSINEKLHEESLVMSGLRDDLIDIRTAVEKSLQQTNSQSNSILSLYEKYLSLLQQIESNKEMITKIRKELNVVCKDYYTKDNETIDCEHFFGSP